MDPRRRLMGGGDCIMHADLSRDDGGNRRTAVMVVNGDRRRVKVRGTAVGHWEGGR
jgi:hypothetical protein